MDVGEWCWFGADVSSMVMLGGTAHGRVVSALVSCTVDSWFSCTAGRVLWQYPCCDLHIVCMVENFCPSDLGGINHYHNFFPMLVMQYIQRCGKGRGLGWKLSSEAFPIRQMVKPSASVAGMAIYSFSPASGLKIAKIAAYIFVS